METKPTCRRHCSVEKSGLNLGACVVLLIKFFMMCYQLVCSQKLVTRFAYYSDLTIGLRKQNQARKIKSRNKYGQVLILVIH